MNLKHKLDPFMAVICFPNPDPNDTSTWKTLKT